MKKFLYQVLVFLFCFILMNVAYLLLVRNFDWNFAKHIEALQLSPRNYECLVLGNSLAMDGIDTKYLSDQGMSSYNLSMGGASLNTSKLQLEQYLSKVSKIPKYVLLGLGSCIGENYEKTSIHPLLRTQEAGITIYQLPIIKYRWMAKELGKKLVSRDHRTAKLVNGQLRIARTIADTSQLRADRLSVLNRNFYQELSTLNEIARICEEKNIELVVIEMPGFRNTQNDIPIGPYKLGITSKYQFYNFNNRIFCELFDSEADWLGGSHLNEKGARKFTEKMSKMVGF